MGYMGFGMNKKVYTRKPKQAFSKLKSIYGQELRIRTISTSKTTQKLSEREKNKIRIDVKRKYLALQLKPLIITTAILAILITIVVKIILPFLFTYKIPEFPNGQVKQEVILNSGTYSRIVINYYENGIMRLSTFYSLDHKLCKQITRDSLNNVLTIQEW